MREIEASKLAERGIFPGLFNNSCELGLSKADAQRDTESKSNPMDSINRMIVSVLAHSVRVPSKLNALIFCRQIDA